MSNNSSWGFDEEKWDSEHDSTWEDDEEYRHQKELKTNTSRKRSYNRAAKDLKRYRHGYPDPMPNLNFYRNKIHFEPYGEFIDDLHNYWKTDYYTLESNHNFIQWLFPLQEPGMNRSATPLTKEEIKEMKNDEEVMKRFMESYKLMLGFYGIKLIDEESGKVERAKNWEERFSNLNNNTHNNLRITRILKCLGELGKEHFQFPLVMFFLEETLCHGNLENVKSTVLNYFMFTVKNKCERKELVLFAWEHFEPKNMFIWGPKEVLWKLKPPATKIQENEKHSGSDDDSATQSKNQHYNRESLGRKTKSISSGLRKTKNRKSSKKSMIKENQNWPVEFATPTDHKSTEDNGNTGLCILVESGPEDDKQIENATGCWSENSNMKAKESIQSGNTKENEEPTTYLEKKIGETNMQFGPGNEVNEGPPTKSSLEESEDNQSLPTMVSREDEKVHGGTQIPFNLEGEMKNGVPPVGYGSYTENENKGTQVQPRSDDKENLGQITKCGTENNEENGGTFVHSKENMNKLPQPKSGLEQGKENERPPSESLKEKGKEHNKTPSEPGLEETKEGEKLPSESEEDMANKRPPLDLGIAETKEIERPTSESRIKKGNEHTKLPSESEIEECKKNERPTSESGIKESNEHTTSPSESGTEECKKNERPLLEPGIKEGNEHTTSPSESEIEDSNKNERPLLEPGIKEGNEQTKSPSESEEEKVYYVPASKPRIEKCKIERLLSESGIKEGNEHTKSPSESEEEQVYYVRSIELASEARIEPCKSERLLSESGIKEGNEHTKSPSESGTEECNKNERPISESGIKEGNEHIQSPSESGIEECKKNERLLSQSGIKEGNDSKKSLSEPEEGKEDKRPPSGIESNENESPPLKCGNEEGKENEMQPIESEIDEDKEHEGPQYCAGQKMEC